MGKIGRTRIKHHASSKNIEDEDNELSIADPISAEPPTKQILPSSIGGQQPKKLMGSSSKKPPSSTATAASSNDNTVESTNPQSDIRVTKNLKRQLRHEKFLQSLQLNY